MVNLALEYRNTGKHKVLLIWVLYGSGIVQVEQVQEEYAWKCVSLKTQPGGAPGPNEP